MNFREASALLSVIGGIGSFATMAYYVAARRPGMAALWGLMAAVPLYMRVFAASVR